jgi:hypothetical protein
VRSRGRRGAGHMGARPYRRLSCALAMQYLPRLERLMSALLLSVVPLAVVRERGSHSP